LRHELTGEHGKKKGRTLNNKRKGARNWELVIQKQRRKKKGKKARIDEESTKQDRLKYARRKQEKEVS